MPNGVTGSSTTTAIELDFLEAAGNIEIQVNANNGDCDGNASTYVITVLPSPKNPAVDHIDQPTCDLATGSIFLTNLPDTGTWILRNILNDNEITGQGSAITLEDLEPGDYAFEVRNASGCTSRFFTTVNIHSQPLTPPTPTITNIEYELHSDSPDGNQWYNAFGPIPGATGQDYTATEGGFYYVIVTLNGCSSGGSNVIELFNVSVNPGLLKAAVNLYPNPVKDKLSIELNGISKKVNLKILDATGVEIDQDKFTEHYVLDTSSYPPGVYFIQIRSGNAVSSYRVVKD